MKVSRQLLDLWQVESFPEVGGIYWRKRTLLLISDVRELQVEHAEALALARYFARLVGSLPADMIPSHNEKLRRVAELAGLDDWRCL